MENTEPQIPVSAEIDASKRIAEMEQMQARAQAILASIAEHDSAAKIAVQNAVESQRLAAEGRAAIQALLDETAAASTQALAAKTQITDFQAVIATKSAHIEDAKAHSDKVRTDLDRASVAASQSATEAEGLKARTQASADAIAALQASIQASKGLVDTEVSNIEAARATCEESAITLKGLSDKAATVQKRIADYETRLAGLEKQCADQLKTITDLLPGATSAGLAHAFDARRQTFLNPAERWQWLFIASILLLIGLALTGLWNVYQGSSVISYDELGRLWLARFPVAAALVWLALHSSRESALAKRLEEDYGYKAAIAASFQGFHKQMSDLGATAGPDTPLAQLCGDTLATIGNPPGRIYEKHALVVTPSDEIKETTKNMLPQAHN